MLLIQCPYCEADRPGPEFAKTPVKNLYVNCSLNLGDIEARSGLAQVFVDAIARDEPRRIGPGFTLERFRTGQVFDEAATAAVAH